MKTNKQRMEEILKPGARYRGIERLLGNKVIWRGQHGVVDAVFLDLDSAIDHFVVPDDWYDIQEVRPKSQKTDRWYSVILENGGVLVGELDFDD